MQVDGALVIRAVPGAKVTIGKLEVKNEGWEWKPLVEGEPALEEEKIRWKTTAPLCHLMTDNIDYAT